MAVAVPLRVCAEPGCPARVRKGRCPEHQHRVRQEARRYQQGETAYNSTRWVWTSKRFKAEHPFCINGRKVPGCTLLTDVTDHILPHRGEAALFWDEHNWQPLCWSCHSRKTAQETGWANSHG